ncbi:MAG: TonB-dependent receptor [Deltaproteobacteria bacterium]|nr:TonB-dependent receptor [Deltaproteobacteria bacterium]
MASLLGVPAAFSRPQTSTRNQTEAEGKKADPDEKKETPQKDFEDFAELDIAALLDEEVVTASKRAEGIEDAPSIVTVFTRKDMDRLGIRRLIDLLRLTPGFVEVSSPMERNIASRGVHSSTSQNVVILVDGLRMNDFLTNTAAPDGFILDMAERVEIIRGPGAALYGSNALTGVINIITRDGDKTQGFSAKVGYGSSDAIDLSAQHGHRFEDGSSLYLSGTFMQSHGTRHLVPGQEDILLPLYGQNLADAMQEGENLTQPRGTTPVWVNHYGPSYETLLKYKRPDDWTFRIGSARKHFHPQRASNQSLLDVVAQSQRPVRIDTRTFIDLAKSWGSSSEYGRFTFRPSILHFGHQERSQLIAEEFFDLAAEEAQTSIQNWSGEELRFSLSLEYAVDLGDWAFLRDMTLLAGINAEYDVAYNYRLSYCKPDPDNIHPPSTYSEENTGHDYICHSGAPMLDEGATVDKWGNLLLRNKSFLGNGDDLLWGGFLHLSTRLPWDVGLTLGGRVDFNYDYDPMLTPRIALVKSFEKTFYLKGIFSSAFVYPPFLYRTGNRQAGIIGNPDMKPQSIKTLEALLGFRMDILRIELNAYYNLVSDFITYDDQLLANSRQYFFDNYGDLHIFGVEGSAIVYLWDGRIDARLSAGFAMPLDATDDRFIVDGQLGGPSKYPPYFGSFILNGRPLDNLEIGFSGVYAAATEFRLAQGNTFVDVQGTDGRTHSTQAAEDYDTSTFFIDLHASYTLFESYRLSVLAKNLLGSEWRMTGATMVPYVTEGRQVMVFVSYLH